MEFSKELYDDIAAGDITLTVRLWRRRQVKVGGRYRVSLAEIEVDRMEQVPFSSITDADVRLAGEESREVLRARAAHAGPIAEDTLVYRIEFHTVTGRIPAGSDPRASARRSPVTSRHCRATRRLRHTELDQEVSHAAASHRQSDRERHRTRRDAAVD